MTRAHSGPPGAPQHLGPGKDRGVTETLPCAPSGSRAFGLQNPAQVCPDELLGLPWDLGEHLDAFLGSRVCTPRPHVSLQK